MTSTVLRLNELQLQQIKDALPESCPVRLRRKIDSALFSCGYLKKRKSMKVPAHAMPKSKYALDVDDFR